jgi:ubiquinone/menaquinone biosynthesis C-methylase UbiE
MKEAMLAPSSFKSGRLTRGTSWVAGAARFFSKWHYLHAIEQYVAEGKSLLEFGCGSGEAFLPARFLATGLDIDFQATHVVGGVYQQAVNGDIGHLPFAPQSFDAAASSFVLEHLPLGLAESALGEIHRVLRPGGVLICLCDLDCDHPMLAVLRRKFPKGYQEALVEVPGHLGLRREGMWSQLVKSAGFEIHSWQLMSRFPLLDFAPWGYLASGPSMPAYIRRIGRCANWISGLGWPGTAWIYSIILLDDVFRPFLPCAWAYRLLFAARKRET